MVKKNTMKIKILSVSRVNEFRVNQIKVYFNIFIAEKENFNLRS
jgi:hypothetical protein